MTTVTQKKIVPTVALLLCPYEIEQQNCFLHALHIRIGTNVPFEIFPLDQIQIERYFQKLNSDGYNLLSNFNEQVVTFEKNQILKRHAREKSGMSSERYLDKMLYRHFYDLTKMLLKHCGAVSYYHRIKNQQTGNYLIARCHWEDKVPALSFEVEKNFEGKLMIRPCFSVDGHNIQTREWIRYKFLLATETANYFLLNYTDFITLEWLEAANPAQFADDPISFAQRIVQKLEETHEVNRNDCFEKIEIDVEPISCVFLSEVSDTMLMFTPRWKYEGILVDGSWKEVHETTRNGVLYAIKRNKTAEDNFVAYLKSLHPNFAKQNAHFYYLSFSDAKKKQWFLKAYHDLIARDTEILGLEMLRHFRYSPHAVTTYMSIVQQMDDHITVQLQVSFGKEKVELSELQKLLFAGQNSILLKDNTIGLFDDEWLSQYATIIKHGKIKKDQLTIARWLMLAIDEGAAQAALKPAISEAWVEKWMQWQQKEITVYEVPVSINAQLRNYQHKGFEWLVLLSEIGAGACLADDMGLGKTLQTITFLAYRQQQNQNARFLIACPASLLYNWKQELEKFAPHLKATVYNGLNRNLNPFIQDNHSVLICSYGTLRSDIEKLKLIPWDTAVIDESQHIKNIQAQVTRATYELDAAARVALSGTPVMNNTFDLYAQLNFLLPGMFGSQEFFRKEYAQPIDRDGDKSKVAALQKLTAPFVLRRTKKQVAADLPEKTESVLWCDMGEDQWAIYNETKNQIKESIFLCIQNEGLGKSKLNILQGILKLRQICSAPQLIAEHANAPSVKIEVLMEELNKLRNSKVLIFSQFKGMLHLIAQACKSQKIAYYHFDGDTPIEERIAMVNRFQSPDDLTGVFLISLKTGNAGLNLTAAEYVFLVDPWWNTAVQQQAIDRTHRIGQTKSVFAYKMICRNSIEERIVALQQKKQMLSEELISPEDGLVKNLSMEDVAYLFE